MGSVSFNPVTASGAGLAAAGGVLAGDVATRVGADTPAGIITVEVLGPTVTPLGSVPVAVAVFVTLPRLTSAEVVV